MFFIQARVELVIHTCKRTVFRFLRETSRILVEVAALCIKCDLREFSLVHLLLLVDGELTGALVDKKEKTTDN